MLDLGLTKMALIGVVALVVLGPERLPGVARTAGALFGRAQRYINDVKSEVAREMELDELKKMRTRVRDGGVECRDARSTTICASTKPNSTTRGIRARRSSPSIAGSGEADTATVGNSWRSGSSSGKRKNWRVKQSAVPTGTSARPAGAPACNRGRRALPVIRPRRCVVRRSFSDPVSDPFH